jgi:hypothetical protein
LHCAVEETQFDAYDVAAAFGGSAKKNTFFPAPGDVPSPSVAGHSGIDLSVGDLTLLLRRSCQVVKLAVATSSDQRFADLPATDRPMKLS